MTTDHYATKHCETTKCLDILRKHQRTLPYISEWQQVLLTIAQHEDVDYTLLSTIYDLDVKKSLQDEVLSRGAGTGRTAW